ncbi:MAG: LacI family DNA-binding transcriptional regulator [Ktedonobacteraceae bacterium]|nr:LacI family DNA-binding transcriptional regulator [Ktedonobacteraceae bacterium]
MHYRSDRSDEVTIFDVAKEAGVSYATVSRVINNKEHVSAEKRERVLRAMAQLGYVANVQARSLAGGRTQIIGLLVHELNNDYIGEIIKGIDNEMAESHYDIMLYTTHRRKTKESVYVTRLTRNLVDGLLLVLPRNAGAYLETLHKRRFPHVLVDHEGIRQGVSVPSIVAENWKGAYDATCYLLQLGHRRIGFITGAMEMGCAQDRLAGYRAALLKHSIPVIPELIREGNFLQPRGYSSAKELLSLAEPPTAIFASNDISAFGVMEAVRDQGLQIPRDIAIVGFDDIPQATHVHPPLTTVRQPLEEMGRRAAGLLLHYIANPAAEVECIELPTELIIRESCQAPRTPLSR